MRRFYYVTAGNVHKFFAPFKAKLQKTFFLCIYMGLILFSHVHLAEFNILPLPMVAEFLWIIGFFFSLLVWGQKKDAVGLSSKVLPPQYQVYCMAYDHLLSDACLSECLSCCSLDLLHELSVWGGCHNMKLSLLGSFVLPFIHIVLSVSL